MPGDISTTDLSSQLDLFVISLAHRKDRRDWMQAQADRLDLHLHFFDAVNGVQTPPEIFARHFAKAEPLGKFEAGDMACTLSHLRVFEQFLRGTKDYCAVFEDDVRMADDLPLWLNDLFWIPAGCDLIKLEVSTQKGLMVLLGKSGASHKARDLRQLLSRHTGAAAYIISRDAARRVLRQRALVDLPIDHLLFNANVSPIADKLNILQITPALAYQDEAAGDSDLVILRKKALPRTTYWKREVRRAMAELSLLPRQISALLFKGARLIKIEWISRSDTSTPAPQRLLSHRQ